ncbi:MAG: histidine phosphatase family protein [Chlamydiia bacterium]
MSRLILLRHGQSMWNQLNLFCGWVDVPLSAVGIREAQAAGALISHYPIDWIFTGELERAVETAMIAMASHPSGRVPVLLHEGEGILDEWSAPCETIRSQIIPVRRARALNERMYGSLQGMNKDEARAQFGADQVHQWRRSYDQAPPGGESLADTAARTLPYFNKEILPLVKKGEQVLVCAHGNSLRSIIMEIEGMSHEEILHFELETGIPRVYRWEMGQLILEPSS